MSLQDFLPSIRSVAKEPAEDVFSSLRKQVEHLFDDYGNGFFPQTTAISMRSNVSETDKEICITAELPGLMVEDVDVSVNGDQIVIKGEKKSEKEEKADDQGREFHVIERASGSFWRAMTLPFQINADLVKAVVKDGVLTVTVPKPPEAVEKVKKINVAYAK